MHCVALHIFQMMFVLLLSEAHRCWLEVVKISTAKVMRALSVRRCNMHSDREKILHNAGIVVKQGAVFCICLLLDFCISV